MSTVYTIIKYMASLGRAWSNPTSNYIAYARAGGRRRRTLQQRLLKEERKLELLKFCVEKNYPFTSNTKDFYLDFLEIQQEKCRDYYVSYYTIFYELREIFGDNYIEVYKFAASVGDFDYPSAILQQITNINNAKNNQEKG